jgi:ribosomal protein L11 methyltransferase
VPWLQLRMDTRRSQVEQLEELMLSTGAVAVTMEDNADEPVLEPGVGETPLWGQIRLSGLYDAGTNMEDTLAAFPAELVAQSQHRVEILEDKDWERQWMQHYQAMQFGDKLWVCPSWLPPPDPSATTVLLDPGLAFGTGTHPTTALCLTQLSSMDLRGKQVVDYGCGSGILAVAAIKLGAAHALCIDNDPQALAATEDNARRNSIDISQYRVAGPEKDTTAHSGTVDLVIANILAGPLLELSDRLLAFLKPGGTLMLSGLIESQAMALCEHYSDRIEIEIAGETDGWICLRGALSDTP